MRRRILCICLCLVAMILLSGCQSSDYKTAVTLYDSGKYDEAETAFSALNGYKDSASYLVDIPYQKALVLFSEGKYTDALSAFTSLGEYKDSADYVKKCEYMLAVSLFEAKDYDAAEEAFTALSEYEDSADYLADIPYQKAQQLLSNGEYSAAERAFALLDDYKDSKKMVSETKYQAGLAAFESKDYDSAEKIFEELEDYRDSAYMLSDVRNTRTYSQAEQARADEQYDEAIALFESLGSFEDSEVKAAEALEAKNASLYAEAEALLAEKEFDAAAERFRSLEGYLDSSERADQAVEAKHENAYYEAEAYVTEGEYYSAIAAFEALGEYKDSQARVEDIKKTIIESFHVDNLVISHYAFDAEASWGNYEYYDAILESDIKDPFLAVIMRYDEIGEQLGYGLVPMINGEGNYRFSINTETQTGPDDTVLIAGYFNGIKVDPSDYSFLLDSKSTEYTDYEYIEETSCSAHWTIKSNGEKTGLLVCSVITPGNDEPVTVCLALVNGEGNLYRYISDLPYKQRGFRYEIEPLFFCQAYAIHEEDYEVIEPYHVDTNDYSSFKTYSGTVRFGLQNYPDCLVIGTRKQVASPNIQGFIQENIGLGAFIINGSVTIGTYESVDKEDISSESSLPIYEFSLTGYIPWHDYDDPLIKRIEEKRAAAEAAKADRLAAIKAAGVITVATSPDFAPMEFVDTSKSGQDQYVGFDISLAKFIAEYIGVDLEIKAMSFSDCQIATARGDVDISISGYSWTESRAEHFEVSDYYYAGEGDSEQVLLIRAKDADKYTKAKDFDGATIGAQSASLQLQLVTEQLPNSRPYIVTEISEGVLSLQSGIVDALAVAGGNAYQILLANPDLVICVWEFEAKDEYDANVILIPKGEVALADIVNEALTKANEEGLYDKWYEEAISQSASANALEVAVEDKLEAENTEIPFEEKLPGEYYIYSIRYENGLYIVIPDFPDPDIGKMTLLMDGTITLETQESFETSSWEWDGQQLFVEGDPVTVLSDGVLMVEVDGMTFYMAKPDADLSFIPSE